jgi:hypothetical protein
MSSMADCHRRWEVRPTLRLLSPFPDPISTDNVRRSLDGVADVLRKDPDVAAAYVGLAFSTYSQGITATIVPAQPSTPGAAADLAIRLLAETCNALGLTVDVIKEVVVEMADVDPRSL